MGEEKTVIKKDESKKMTNDEILKKIKESKPVFEELSTQESTKEEKNENKKEDSIPLFFEKEASIYRFDDTWISCGCGTVCITEDKTRIFFKRKNISLLAFDFLMNFDMEPSRKNKDVIFLGIKHEINSDPVVKSFALRFATEDDAIEFEGLIKKD